MKSYNFHGNTPVSNIGKELREITRNSKSDFKIITGYGSTCGKSKSRDMALKSLRKMKSEGLIKGYIPANELVSLLWSDDKYYETKSVFGSRVKNDNDARIGNDGVIFVFVS